MAGFRLTKPYTMPKEDLWRAAQQLADRLQEEHGVRSRWEGDSVHIKGGGIDGQLSFHDGVVDVSVRLGLLVSAFQRPLKAEVERYLDEMIS